MSTQDPTTDLDLENIEPDGKTAPERRVSTVKAASSIFTKLKDADKASARNRARIDAMFDGVPPYDQGELIRTGQGSRTNLNFGEAQRFLDIAMASFVDLYDSLQRFVHIPIKRGVADPGFARAAGQIIAEELTDVLRSWPRFHSHFLRLANHFAKHGVGAAWFDRPDSWQFSVGGLDDFKVPRQTVVDEEAVEVAATQKQFLVHELWGFIKNEEVAEKAGWNVKEVKRALLQNATNTENRPYDDWETLQRTLKNNDINEGVRATSVDCVMLRVREFSGKVSVYYFVEDCPEDFLYVKEDAYDRPSSAFVLFTYGAGSNGTLHSVRGLGHRIFNHVQTSNRLRCQMVDGAMVSSGLILQPEGERDLDKLSFTFYGPYALLAPNLNVVERPVPDLTRSVVPALGEIQTQLLQNVDQHNTYGVQSHPYRNEMQVMGDMAAEGALSGATLNLFYASWQRLLREIVRKMITGRADDFTRALFERCAQRGISEDIVKAVDFDRVTAVRAVGRGSRRDRLFALRELHGISGSFDEQGRRTLVREISTGLVGRDLTDELIPDDPEPRLTVDVKVALLENSKLIRGEEIPVLDNEPHGLHLIHGHAPALSEAIGRVQSGEDDPMEVLPGLMAMHQHVEQHLAQYSLDPFAQSEVARLRQLMQVSHEVIVNFGRRAQKLERERREAEGQAAEGQQQPSQLDMKLREHELRMRMAEQKAELDMRIKQAKFEQEQALRDAAQAAGLNAVQSFRAQNEAASRREHLRGLPR